MLKFRYVGLKTVYLVNFKKLGMNRVKIYGIIPAKTKGFVLSRVNHKDEWDYSSYTTIWKEEEDGVIYSNDGSVYTAPPEPEPLPEPTQEEIAERERITKISTINVQIEHLEQELKKNDYIFTKSEEYTVVGKPLADYDYEKLSEERDALRAQIDELRLELDEVINAGVSSY